MQPLGRRRRRHARRGARQRHHVERNRARHRQRYWLRFGGFFGRRTRFNGGKLRRRDFRGRCRQRRGQRHGCFNRILTARSSKSGDGGFDDRRHLRQPCDGLAMKVRQHRGFRGSAGENERARAGVVARDGDGNLRHRRRRRRRYRNVADAGTDTIRKFGNVTGEFSDARTAVVEQFRRGIDRADIGDIERGERHCGGGENRAETLEIAENLFFDRQFVRIEIDWTLEQRPLSRCARHFLSSIAATLSAADAFESFLQNKGKCTWLF